MIKRLAKYGGMVVVFCFGVFVLFKTGEMTASVNVDSIENKKNALLNFASHFQVARVLVVGSVFIIFWKPVSSLIFHQSGLEIGSARWRWMGFYFAAEVVIYVQIFGSM